MIIKNTGWFDPTRIENLLVHSEEICEGLSYLETLKVLSEHATQDESRKPLFNDYKKLVYPRLVGLLESWK